VWGQEKRQSRGSDTLQSCLAEYLSGSSQALLLTLRLIKVIDVSVVILAVLFSGEYGPGTLSDAFFCIADPGKISPCGEPRLTTTRGLKLLGIQAFVCSTLSESYAH
jgi:hypothetical protein